MNKIIKTTVVAMICAVLCVLLCSCGGEKLEQLSDDVNQVSVKSPDTDGWVFVYSDNETLAPLVEMYNSIEYKENEDGAVFGSNGGVYEMGFSNGKEIKATFRIDSDKNFMIDTTGKVYTITSDFDYNEMARILQSKLDESMAEHNADVTEAQTQPASDSSQKGNK